MMLFNQTKIDNSLKLNGREIKENDILIINGSRKNKGGYFLDNVAIQQNPVVLRISQLGKGEDEKI